MNVDRCNDNKKVVHVILEVFGGPPGGVVDNDAALQAQCAAALRLKAIADDPDTNLTEVLIGRPESTVPGALETHLSRFIAALELQTKLEFGTSTRSRVHSASHAALCPLRCGSHRPFPSRQS